MCGDIYTPSQRRLDPCLLSDGDVWVIPGLRPNYLGVLLNSLQYLHEQIAHYTPQQSKRGKNVIDKSKNGRIY